MKYSLCILLISVVIACNDNTNTDVEPPEYRSPDAAKVVPPAIENEQDADLTGCYMKILGRDTAILMIEQKGNDVSGKMLYDNFEKDGSRGTLTGKDDKEILKLWYHFTSEGIRSVMEVYFKKENGRLLRGIGDMDVKTDTTYFISGINYSDKETFTKVDCSLIGWKLKF